MISSHLLYNEKLEILVRLTVKDTLGNYVFSSPTSIALGESSTQLDLKNFVIQTETLSSKDCKMNFALLNLLTEHLKKWRVINNVQIEQDINTIVERENRASLQEMQPLNKDISTPQ